MIIKELIELFDDWNIPIKVNNKDLSEHISEKNIWLFWKTRKELLSKEIIAFGIYDGKMTVRIDC